MSSAELNGVPKVSNEKNNWWNELSDKQKKQILAGLKDADKGKLSSSKEFWNKLKNA